MTLKELREEITKTEHSDWFKDIATLRIEIPHLNISEEIKGFVATFKYVNDQVTGYENISEQLPGVLATSKDNWIHIRNYLISFFSENKDRDISSINNLWAQTKSRIQSILSNQNRLIFPYDRPETDFLIQVQQFDSGAVVGATDFLLGRQIGNIQDPRYFQGVLLAYEFKMGDGSKIFGRRKKESSSLNALRSGFNSHIEEAENQLQEFLVRSKSKTEADAAEIDDFLAEKKKTFADWFDGSSQSFHEFDEASKKRILELEDIYQKQLKLSKPADYWKKRAVALNVEGKTWLKWLAVCVTVAALSLFVLLWQIPDGMLLNIFSGEASAIKWALVYITFLSFIAFGIRTLAKITFSSFHLARDAEEREQLTYVYLALMQEAKIDEKERNLIMQALFSRADTGLLKEDSSPTMPGIVDRFIQR